MLPRSALHPAPDPSVGAPPDDAAGSAAHAADSPCTACGACCASLRVSFYWAEGDDAPGGWVPVAFTRQLTPHLRVMRGTESQPPRCEALAGEPGTAVRCSIYAQRPTPCREFNWHGEDGQPNPRCKARRVALGLAALPDPEATACALPATGGEVGP
jgi:Fe-S-cluster containining protein